ncbi:MAG: rod shape-determining protein MreC [Planctomycetes bacterium]|nr:rod shape-determining protein MreC [Planctomycetota bacterium]
MVALLFAGIVILFVPQEHTKKLNFLFRKLFNPVLSLGRSTTVAFPVFTSSNEDFVSGSEYNRLVTDYDNLQGALKELHQQYNTLAGIRARLPEAGSGYVLAGIRDVSTDPLRKELVINKGQLDGLRVEQYVLGGNTIVGQVSETSPRWSRIKLLTDSGSSVEVGIWNEKLKKYIRAQLVGDGKGAATIPLISREYDIRADDTVYAAPKPGLLETPMVIGNIVSIAPDDNKPLLWDMTVKPLYDAEKLENVVIIVVEPVGEPK